MSMWQAIATRPQGAFLLRDATVRYLRANSRCLLPYVLLRSAHLRPRRPCTATKWALERVPRADRPELPIPAAPDSLFARLCPPLSRLCVLERDIRWVRADVYGTFSENDWTASRYTGKRPTIHQRQLMDLLPPMDNPPDYTLCVRAGRFGQLSPLVVNLTRSREPLSIVLIERNTAVDNAFVYPDVHAVAGEAAVEEPVL